MKTAINKLQESINSTLERMDIIASKNFDPLYLLDLKREINEYRMAILVLKYFNIEDVIIKR